MLALGERTRAKASVVVAAPRPYNVGSHSINSARGGEGFTLSPSVRLRLRYLSFTAMMCGIRGVGESFVSPIDGVRTLIGLEQARSSQKLPRLFAFLLHGALAQPAADGLKQFYSCRLLQSRY